MRYVVFCFAFSFVYYLSVGFSGLFSLAGEETVVFMLLITRNFVLSVRWSFLFSGCFG